MPPSLQPQDKFWATAAHLTILLGFLIPLGGLAAAFAILLAKKNTNEFVSLHARESLNFQLSTLIYVLVAVILLIGHKLLAPHSKYDHFMQQTNSISPLGLVLFCLFMLGLVLWEIIQMIVASIKASDGYFYRYPLALPLLRG